MLQPWRSPSAHEKLLLAKEKSTTTTTKKNSRSARYHLHASNHCRQEIRSKPVNASGSMDRRIKLSSLNTYITCKLCGGYFIDATTVTECLHTFCKSCIVKHLEDNNTCPTCNIVIHQSYPLQYISFDRTMQDIVFKIVPHLQENEYHREREFYRSRGLPYPKVLPLSNEEKESGSKGGSGVGNCGGGVGGGAASSSSSRSAGGPESAGGGVDADYHRTDEQVTICLECCSVTLKQLKRKFVRCSSHATVTHLKKFVAKKVFNNYDKYKDVDILCNEEILGKDHTLKFVCITRWRFKDPPLLLQYRPRVEL